MSVIALRIDEVSRLLIGLEMVRKKNGIRGIYGFQDIALSKKFQTATAHASNSKLELTPHWACCYDEIKFDWRTLWTRARCGLVLAAFPGRRRGIDEGGMRRRNKVPTYQPWMPSALFVTDVIPRLSTVAGVMC